MPRLSARAIANLLRRLPDDELKDALQNRIITAVSLPNVLFHAACGMPAVQRARSLGLGLLAYGDPADFLEAVHAVLGRRLLKEATSGLARRHPDFSARQRMTLWQAFMLALFIAVAMGAGLLLPLDIFIPVAAAVSGLFFLAVVALRVLCLLPRPETKEREAAALAEEALPVYSVLVPLFREVAVLDQLLGALRRMHYPPDKLDIKLILEAEDSAMHRAIGELALEAQFEVIVVPAGRPQTKPKAMNYALQFCRGELLTIYDAEDVPQPDQLLKAAQRFATAPRRLACLQAQLTFYNPRENWLTRQFTAEYATLFGALLPVLAAHGLPLPLGGTSNHFRMDVLREVGAWDPYNVTEDADLGMRLARLGYTTGVLDSFTHEEANTRLGNWMNQRARWLKGFLATWLVHMRQPGALLREVGPAGFWAAQVLTLGVFASVLMHPVCMAATVAMWLIYPADHRGAGLPMILLSGMNVAVLFFGYAVSLRLTARALERQGHTGWWMTMLTMPAYWLLMSAAAWAALWQFAARPFHWNKTEHGLSVGVRVIARPGHSTG